MGILSYRPIKILKNTVFNEFNFKSNITDDGDELNDVLQNCRQLIILSTMLSKYRKVLNSIKNNVNIYCSYYTTGNIIGTLFDTPNTTLRFRIGLLTPCITNLFLDSIFFHSFTTNISVTSFGFDLYYFASTH